MPKLIATKNSPTTKPAPKPSAALAFGPRNTPKISADNRLHMNAIAKIRAGCGGADAGSIPASRHHAFLNSGPYHSPPSTNAETAAAITASQLRSIGGMVMGSSGLE